MFLTLFLPASGFRFGEATHPGPSCADDDLALTSGYSFALGTANVAGLSNKIDVIGLLPPGIWGLTETHLTQQAMKPTQMAIKQMGRAVGRHVRTIYGAPAPSRTVDSYAGTWTGVCTLSDFPCHAVDVPWPEGVFTSARTMISSHFVGGSHLILGTLYGVAQSPSYKDPLTLTRVMLQTLVDEVALSSRGPRCLMGDWNCDLMQFPEMEFLRSRGWREVQIHAWHLHQKPIEPTCKRTTVRDYVWCSPELLQYFVSTSVDHDMFPDHSSVCGFFHFPAERPSTWTWPMPKPIPWEHSNTDDWHAQTQQSWSPFTWAADTTKDFSAWSQHVESSLRPFLATPSGRLPVGCGGRGMHLQRKKVPCAQPTVKPCRPGEEKLQVAFPNRCLLQWYRQLRRLQSLVHGCRNGTATLSAWTYQTQCWSAVIRASGFNPTFRKWWERRPIKLQSSPLTLEGLPALADLESVFHDFRLNFRHMEQWFGRQKSKLLQVRRETSMKDLFRSLRPPGPEPLDFLMATSHHTITQIAPATGAVLLDSEPDFHRGMWVFAGAQICPSPCDGVALETPLRAWCTFESDRLPVLGHRLTQHVPVTSIDQIHSSLLEF